VVSEAARLSHPGPATARLPRSIADAIAAQARAEYPLEACGLIPGSAAVADGGVALRYVACRNAAASPVRYTVHPDDLFRVIVDADDADEVIWGIVHSHVRSPAIPSPTDVGLALYPDALYLLVSLAEGPALRAWRIVDGAIHEVTLEIE
jgi:[CysO sulfur-carrier protein]-S-L-cysteine hydrolase